MNIAEIKREAEEAHEGSFVHVWRHDLLALIQRVQDAEVALAEVDNLLILGWDIDGALDEHGDDEIGEAARNVQQRVKDRRSRSLTQGDSDG